MKIAVSFLWVIGLALVGCNRRPDYAIILAGNSILANVTDVPFGKKLSAALPQALRAAQVPGRADVTANLSNYGGLTSRMLARDSAGVARAYQVERPTVLLVYEGSNDLWYLMNVHTSAAGLQAYRNLKQFLMDRKAQFPHLLTVTGTVLPRTDAPNPAGFERERLVLNEQLRQAWHRQEPWLDALADPAQNPKMLHPGPKGMTSLYYKDGVHPSVAGLAEIVPLFAQAVGNALAHASKR